MQRRILFSSLAVCALGTLLFSSCEDNKLGDLTISLPETSESVYEIAPGETLKIPFTVGELSFAGVEYSVTSEVNDYLVSVVPAATSTDQTIDTLVVKAPEYILDEESFDVNLKATDGSRSIDRIVKVKSVYADNFVILTAAANSYIVKPGSFVKFPAFEGSTSKAVSFDTANLLWEDSKDMVTNVITRSGDNNIYVQLAEGKSGNAVVEAKSGDVVVWSWNLWVTDYDPEANTMEYTSSESNTFTFMDRNLGALGAEAGSDAVNGNFYQWGRKDPFVGATYENSLKTMYDAQGNEVEKIIEPVALEDNTQNAIANPLTHFSGVSGGNYGWITNNYANCDLEALKDYWGAVSGKKSAYDPCPAGWKVPTKEALGFYTDASVTFAKVYTEGGSANADFLGWKFTIGGKDFFFPSQGEVQHSGSYAYGVTSTWPCGKIWSATSDNMSSKSYFRSFAVNVSPSSRSFGGLGFGYCLAVRCVKE